MFKPLLRTLPSTTGNISLNCEVNNFYKTESNVWESNIQTSSIMPLQNKFCNNINSVSLLNDKWEQIVKTFYGNYRNIFYLFDLYKGLSVTLMRCAAQARS